jgi:DNA-binding transcriptional ArsR family regulator
MRVHVIIAVEIAIARRTYPTDQADLWDALTNADRIPRWFLPISGDLQAGGRCQIEGNASGEVERCKEPESFAVTWVSVRWCRGSRSRSPPDGEGTSLDRSGDGPARRGEQPAGTIVAALQPRAPMSQAAVSQHLKVLREARLVSVRAEGTRRFYALDQAGLDAAEAWLARLADPLGPFAQPLDALATEVARGRRSRTAPVDQPGPRSGERGSRPA